MSSWKRVSVGSKTGCGMVGGGGVVDDVVQVFHWSGTLAISITASLPPSSRSSVHTADMPGWDHCMCMCSDSGSEDLISPGYLRAAQGGLHRPRPSGMYVHTVCVCHMLSLLSSGCVSHLHSSG